MTNPQLEYYTWGETQSNPTKIRNIEGCSLSPLLFNRVLKALARTKRLEEEIRELQIRSKIIPFVHMYDTQGIPNILLGDF